MKQLIYILLYLLLSVTPARADFGSISMDFHSTSSFHNATRSTASFRSTDAYRTTGAVSTGSFSSISASNFATLNSEGGEFYEEPSYLGPRRGRPGGGGAIGEYEQHSPVGDIPWLLIVILLTATALCRRKFTLRASADK